MSDQAARTPAGTERPGRYDRSFGGLVAAMIATVVFVVGYVGVRAVTRDQPDIQPEVDYLSCVTLVQQGDVEVAYPRQLPAGWISTSADYVAGSRPQWRLGVLTDGNEFVGVVQQDAEVDDLLEEYVDPSADDAGPASPANSLGATDWESWSDPGGDHALITTFDQGPLAGQTLLVYGSALEAQLEAVVSLLTLDPTGQAPSETGCEDTSTR